MKFDKPISLCVITAALSLHAQSFDTTVGGSELYNSTGIITEYHWGDTSGWTGVGYSGGLRYGFFVSMPFKSMSPTFKPYRLEIGDQSISGRLDVDEYDSHHFNARGVSVVRTSESSRLHIFSGLLAEQSIQPYLRFATTSDPTFKGTGLGVISYSRKVSRTLQLHSLNMFTGKITSIQSVGWKMSPSWRFAGAGGFGYGTPYLSGVAEYIRDWIDIRSSYTLANRNFHRQEGPFADNEPLGLNASVQVSPKGLFKMRVARDRSLVYSTGEMFPGQRQPGIISTFDSASFFTTWKGLQINASASAGKAELALGDTRTELVTISRKVFSKWRTGGSLVNMSMPGGSERAYININEIRVNPRLAIRQNYTWMNGQNTFSFGGEWRSNLISFSVDQQMYYSPLAASVGGNAMFQAWTFSVHFRGPRGTNVNLDSMVDPFGRVQWGGYIAGLHYNAISSQTSGDSNKMPAFSKYVVEGAVVDENGSGVWGIALSVGGETVISDENGQFFLHVKSSKPLPLMIDTVSSLQSRPWHLESAPPTVQGWLEDESGEPVRVVIGSGKLVAQN